MHKIQIEPQRVLSDVAPEKCFWVNNGPIIKNIQELPQVLRSLDDVKYKHHVNENKNDFAKWVNDVLGDIVLAKELSNAKTKSAMLKKVSERVEYLKKIVKAR